MPTPDRYRDHFDPEPIERPSPEEYMMDDLHYDPRQSRAWNAAAVAAGMRERVPNASDAEVAEAARALGRAQDFHTHEARWFWADSVLANWRLGDMDLPF